MRGARPLAIGLAAVFALSGCRDHHRAEVADIARLFVRLKLASRSLEGQPERARDARERILLEAGSSPEAFRRETERLRSHPELWKPFWLEVRSVVDSFANAKTKGR